jgi:hypothetical protein
MNDAKAAPKTNERLPQSTGPNANFFFMLQFVFCVKCPEADVTEAQVVIPA